MLRWSEFEAKHPDFALQVAACFLNHHHHVLASLRDDGTPRVSGINVFIHQGEMWFGSMRGSRKTGDLLRDSRCALHSAPLSENLEGGDAKISGVALQISADQALQWRPDSPPNDIYFVLRLKEVSRVTVSGEKLVIEVWDTTRGLRIVERL